MRIKLAKYRLNKAKEILKEGKDSLNVSDLMRLKKKMK